jgi:hypothetical protein
LSFVVCRQSSYTSPNLIVRVNGASYTTFSGGSTFRVDVCGGHGLSNVIEGAFTYGGAVQNVWFTLQGVHFDGSTARTYADGATFDNPYN